MEWYAREGVTALQDSSPTQKFIERIDSVAHAMDSGGPKGALWPGCKEEKVTLALLTNRHSYHTLWSPALISIFMH